MVVQHHPPARVANRADRRGGAGGAVARYFRKRAARLAIETSVDPAAGRTMDPATNPTAAAIVNAVRSLPQTFIISHVCHHVIAAALAYVEKQSGDWLIIPAGVCSKGDGYEYLLVASADPCDGIGCDIDHEHKPEVAAAAVADALRRLPRLTPLGVRSIRHSSGWGRARQDSEP